MNLLSVKKELEQLKALARSRCGCGCVCEYVEVMAGQTLTADQERLLSSNRKCYERSLDKKHVGLSRIIVPVMHRDKSSGSCVLRCSTGLSAKPASDSRGINPIRYHDNECW